MQLSNPLKVTNTLRSLINGWWWSMFSKTGAFLGN